MPTVRYQIRNEYGLADPEVYRAADKDDPEALLEGVAMAGLVGVLRQLGDLAEFAAEVFHNLHEEVMATSARGHGLLLRVLQVEAEFPSIEKAILSETDHSHFAYSAGIDWHANLRIEQNLVIQGDMPRFILDSYEECRGPPRLFMLDKFDVAGAGACLTRYSNPSFFKTASAFSEMMEEVQREKRARKPKKKGSYWRSGETTESFFTPIIDNLQFTASEPVPGKFPARIVKLKHRKLRVSDISSRKSYMEGFLKEESFEQNDSKSSLRCCPNNKILDGAPEIQDVLIGGVTDPLLVRKEFSPLSPKEVTGKVQNQKREDGEFSETVFISSCVSQKNYPNSQNAKEAMLVELGNEVDIHAFDISSDEIDMNTPPLQLAVQNNLLAVSGFITDDDHDSYRSDDIGSELENYVDALNIMESEIETDSERIKSDLSLFNRESQGTNPNINGYLELQPRSSGSGIVGSFDTSLTSEKVKDGMPSLSQSTILIDLPYQQLMVRTVFEETSGIEINHGETGKLERMSEGMPLVPSAGLTSNETYYQKKPNATMVVPISREAFTSYCITDSALKPKPSIEEAQSLASHSDEAISGNTKNTAEVDEHSESFFLPRQTNQVVAFPTCKERPENPTDILEEMNPIEYSEDRISVNITDKGYMPCDSSETEHGILPEKTPAECSKDLYLTLIDDGIGKPYKGLEPDKNDCISGSSLPTIPVGSTVPESQGTSNDLEIDMQSEDLAIEISPNYMEGEVEKRKQTSSVLFPAETHTLPLVESNDSGSYGSTQTSENINDVLQCISDERGSPHGSQNNSVIGQLSGYSEKKMSNDVANTLEIPEPPQTQTKSSFVEVSSVCVKDSLHDSVEKDNETYSLENFSPKSSAFSLEIVSSILQSESFATEIGNISATREEFVHPESSSSSGNVDILGCDALISPAIQYELKHFPDVDEPQESYNGCMLKPLPSGCREDPYANQLHGEVSELIETNGKACAHDGLEFANGSTKLGVQDDLLLLDESKNNSLTGNGIPKGGIDDQVLNMLESAKVTNVDVLLQKDPLSEYDTLHQSEPDIEEPAITRDSILLQSENKSFLLFTENEEIKMFFNSVSASQSCALELSNSSEATLVDVKEDKLYSRENEQDSDSKSENVITEDDTDGEVLSLLQCSNLCSFDVQFQEDPVSEDAALNLHKPLIEQVDGANSDSKTNSVTQDGTNGQILYLLESSNLHSFDVQIQEDLVSKDASLNQHKPEIEETTIASDLTSLKFESKLLAPLCENRDQKAIGIVSSSQVLALDLSNFTYAKLADHNFDDIYMEESLICSREDEQDSDSDASMQHFQVNAERPEVQSERASVSQAFDEPSTAPLYRVQENIESSHIPLDKIFSDESTIIQYNLEHEGILPEPEPETLLNHGCKNELNMPSSWMHENEQIETNICVSFQGVSEHSDGSMSTSEALASGSVVVSDFIIPVPTSGIQEPLKALSGKTISSFPIQEGIEETPPLPPLPPMQWRMGKPQLEYLIACGPQPVMKANPFIFPLNTGSMHINPLPSSKEKLNQHTGPFVLPFSFEESFQNVSSCTDGQLAESLKLSGFPVITLDQRQQLEISSSDLSLLASSKEDGKHSHGNITMDGDNPFTVEPLLKDVIPQHPDLLEAGNPQAIEERRPKLVKLLPGLELERSLEAPIIDRDAIPPLSSFMFMPTAGDSMYQYGYGDFRGYEGESMRYHNLSAPFPVAVHSIPHYGYHMFLREGNSSTMYDIMLADMEGDNSNEKHHSILSRPRDPLIEAVAAHDKSTLRKVSQLDLPLPKPKEDEKNYLLEQIKTKSLNLKPTISKANMAKAPSTNLKVAAILEKANAIRQACAGSDEDDDNNWNDS